MSQAATTAPILDLNDIQPADIIVTRSATPQSRLIQQGSCADYSHALLAVYKGEGIEAVGSGVRKEKLGDLLYEAEAATLYRHTQMNAHFAAWICHYAELQRGKKYDTFGALRSATESGCSPLIGKTQAGFYIQVADNIKAMREGGHDMTFFCSELVVRAFEAAKLPLVNIAARSATPGALIKSNYLKLIKELVL